VKYYKFLSIFLFCGITLLANTKQELSDIISIESNSQQAFHYLFQLTKYHDLLWNLNHPQLKIFTLDEKSLEIKSLYSFKYKNISSNGFLVSWYSIAVSEGVIKIFENAYNAKLKDKVDVFTPDGYPKQNPIDLTKFVQSFMKIKYLFYYRILKDADENKWNDVGYTIKIWSEACDIFQRTPFRKNILLIIDHLLESYDNIPLKEKQYLLKLKNDLSSVN